MPRVDRAHPARWRLFHPGHELAPLIQDAPVVEHVVRIRTRRGRLFEHPHVGFLRRETGLSVVAGDAGAYDVFPYVRTASGPRQDVIEGEVLGLAAAVLAFEAVPVEDRAARQSALYQWAFYHVHESDHRWYWYEH